MDVRPAGNTEQARQSPLPGSPSFGRLVTDTGLTWNEFRRTLRPRYTQAWLQIGTCYLLVAIGVVLHGWVARRLGNGIGLALAPLLAVWGGYWVASLICFLHEAAHYNLHGDKTFNDRLAGLFLCPILAVDIAPYRAMHWQHHLQLGSPEDTEVSYHYAPTFRFLLEAVFGVHALRTLRRNRTSRPASSEGDCGRRTEAAAWLRAAIFHSLVLIPALLAGAASTAVAWAMAMVFAYPFFNAMRQLLEHRSSEARSTTNYAVAHHGPVNRIFGTDLFSRTFGAAGFNRHLLHHWYPAASYTTFDELESFLRRTELAPVMNEARTTYVATLRALMRTAAEPRRQ